MPLEIKVADGPSRTLEVRRSPRGAVVTVDGKPLSTALNAGAGGSFDITVGTRTDRVYAVVRGDAVWVHAFGRAWELTLADPRQKASAGAASEDTMLAPMPGTVIAVAVQAGDAVHEGQQLVVIESMKMQSEIIAPRDGLVDRMHVEVGDKFQRGSVLVSLVAEGAVKT